MAFYANIQKICFSINFLTLTCELFLKLEMAFLGKCVYKCGVAPCVFEEFLLLSGLWPSSNGFFSQKSIEERKHVYVKSGIS